LIFYDRMFGRWRKNWVFLEMPCWKAMPQCRNLTPLLGIYFQMHMWFNGRGAWIEVVHRGHLREMMRISRDFENSSYGKSMWCCWFPLFVIMLFDFVDGERVPMELGAPKWNSVLQRFDYGEELLSDISRTLSCLCLTSKSFG
jgi:hypothetical protein